MFAESTFVVSIPAGFKLDFGFLVFDVVLISKSRFFLYVFLDFRNVCIQCKCRFFRSLVHNLSERMRLLQ